MRRDSRAADDPLGPESPSGEHQATRDFAREVARSGLFKVAVGVGSFALACLLAGIMVAKAMAQEARDAGIEAAKAHELRIIAVEQQVPQLRQEVFDGRKENRADLKALQDALLTRRPSPRLSEPVPPPKLLDGGTL